MFLQLRPRLRALQEDVKNNRSADDMPIKGTLVTINGDMDFSKTDGYIQFLTMAINAAVEQYGIEDKEWTACLYRIGTAAEMLQDADVRFTGSSKEEFEAYVQKISKITDQEHKHLDPVKLDIMKSDNLIPILQKQLEIGNTMGFYYEESEDVGNELMNDLFDQLYRIRFSKKNRCIDISFFLMDTGYHEHIHDALNTIINTAVYALNCNSTHRKKAHDFDLQEVEKRLDYVKCLIKRAGYLI